MIYQQHSVLAAAVAVAAETDFLAEVPADATVAHLSSFFFSSAVAAATTDSEAAAVTTTAVYG